MNILRKNMEKGVGGIVVVGIAEVVAELAENAGAPPEVKIYIVATISGLIFSIINRIKHRRAK